MFLEGCLKTKTVMRPISASANATDRMRRWRGIFIIGQKSCALHTNTERISETMDNERTPRLDRKATNYTDHLITPCPLLLSAWRLPPWQHCLSPKTKGRNSPNGRITCGRSGSDSPEECRSIAKSDQGAEESRNTSIGPNPSGFTLSLAFAGLHQMRSLVLASNPLVPPVVDMLTSPAKKPPGVFL